MRILVTGASGLLGLNLSLALHGVHQIIGVDRSKLAKVPFELIKMDLQEPGALERVLEQARPEAVIHCAALADLESCEHDPGGTHLLNAVLPADLAGTCVERGIKMLYISTDAVFDGTKDGIYTEADTPNPLSVYARTKLEGETAVLAADPEALVTRVNFFGWSLSGERSLAEFFVNHLSAGRACDGFTDVWFCPLFVGDLAQLLARMLERGLSGLYHAVGSQALSKYEFGLRLARQFGFDESLIRPISVEDSGLIARRANNLRLSVHKLSTALGAEIPDVSTGIRKFYAQQQQGYPQKLRTYQQD